MTLRFPSLSLLRSGVPATTCTEEGVRMVTLGRLGRCVIVVRRQ